MNEKREEVIVLQPGDERAQKIGKAIASQTANDILHSLRDGRKTASDLATVLKIPMGTVKYHIENLLDAGLIEVMETRYSVKGREIKIYGLRDQLLIVAPGVHNIRSILLKYASLFAIVILASLAAYSFLPLLAMQEGPGGGMGVLQDEKSVQAVPAPAMRADYLVPGVSFDPVLAFFLGGCLVILILLLYEVAVWRRMR